MGCGPLPDWLRDKCCFYAIDTFLLCVWRCLVIYRRHVRGETNQVKTKKDIRPTKLVDFEGIAKHNNVNIILYEPKKTRESI